MIRTESKDLPRICQGDIYKNIEYLEYATENSGIVEISKILFPLVLVLTQDCDLQQDYDYRLNEESSSSQDKYLLSVLVVPLYNIEHFYDGNHLSEIGLKMAPFPRKSDATDNKRLKQNEIPRFHYLEFPEDSELVSSVLDFKQYFAVDIKYLNTISKSNFVCKISELYREDISHRFSSFLSRIGLPDITTAQK